MTLVVLELLALLVVSYQVRVTPHLTLLEKVGKMLVAPIQDGGDHLSGMIEERRARRQAIERLRTENQLLKRHSNENQLLEIEISELRAENDRLRAMLNMPPNPEWNKVAARVISTSSRDGDDMFTIDKGSRHGLRRELGVMTPRGVVGIVWETSPSYSKVMAIENPASAVAAMIQDSRYRDAYVTGFKGGGRLENVPNFAVIKVGATVLTSGFDVFPKGLLIGHVTRHEPTSDMFQKVDLAFAESYRHVDEVLVLIPAEVESP